MTKAELIKVVSEKAGTSKKDAEEVVKALCETTIEALKNGDKIALPGFGTFSASKRAERVCKNPRTNETVVVPSCTTMKFKVASAAKEALN